MKKAIILLFSLSLLVFGTPVNDNSQNTSVDVAKVQINEAVADPIYPPIG